MKVIAIPDIHETTYWHSVIEKINDYEKIIFLGDYFDCWENHQPFQLDNFKNIIQFKKYHPEKVEVLWGNHDTSYFLDERCSGHQPVHAIDIKEVLDQSKDYMKAVHIEKNWIFAHGGVSRKWMKCCGIKDPHEINQLFLQRPNFFRWVGPNGFGDNANEGPLWIRPMSLANTHIKGYNQVVGHTEMRGNDKRIIKKDGDTLYFIDISSHDNLTEFEI